MHDPAAGQVRIWRTSNLVAGDAHNHPWLKTSRGFSPGDLQKGGGKGWVISVEGKTIHALRLLILADGRRYKYDLASKEIYRWDTKQRVWILIGVFDKSRGDAVLLDGQSW